MPMTVVGQTGYRSDLKSEKMVGAQVKDKERTNQQSIALLTITAECGKWRVSGK